MMTPEKLATLTDIFRTIFNMPQLELRDDLTALDVPGWDSFNHINLIIQIEEEFHVRFTSEEVGSLKNVGDMIKLLDNKAE